MSLVIISSEIRLWRVRQRPVYKSILITTHADVTGNVFQYEKYPIPEDNNITYCCFGKEVLPGEKSQKGPTQTVPKKHEKCNRWDKSETVESTD